jgi:hypothetical protein
MNFNNYFFSQEPKYIEGKDKRDFPMLIMGGATRHEQEFSSHIENYKNIWRKKLKEKHEIFWKIFYN